MRTRDALGLLAGAALCALLIGISLALLVLLQYTHGANDDDPFDGEPAISLEEMMSRAVKPKKLVRAASHAACGRVHVAWAQRRARVRQRRGGALWSARAELCSTRILCADARSGRRARSHSPSPRPRRCALCSRASSSAASVRHRSNRARRCTDARRACSQVAASDAPAADARGDGELVDDRIRAAYAGPSVSEAEAEAREEGGIVCWICESGPREAVFLECGHGGVCYPCAQKCWSSQRKHSCPMCRQPVTQVVRIAPEGTPGSDGQLVVDVLS